MDKNLQKVVFEEKWQGEVDVEKPSASISAECEKNENYFSSLLAVVWEYFQVKLSLWIKKKRQNSEYL